MSVGKPRPPEPPLKKAKKAPIPREQAKELLKSKIPKKRRRTGRSKEGERQRDNAVKRAHKYLWCSVKDEHLGPDPNLKLREAQRMMATFANCLATYHDKRGIDWMVRLERKSTEGCMMRASIQREIVGCTFEVYMKAQFFFLNEWYSRAPTYAECASKHAMKRVKDYQELQAGEEIGTEIVSPDTVGESILKENTLAYDSRYDYDEQILEKMILRWGSEEEVWAVCGDFSDETIFSNEFKKTRSVYLEGIQRLNFHSSVNG